MREELLLKLPIYFGTSTTLIEQILHHEEDKDDRYIILVNMWSPKHLYGV
jgi:hypothetical protein